MLIVNDDALNCLNSIPFITYNILFSGMAAALSLFTNPGHTSTQSECVQSSTS